MPYTFVQRFALFLVPRIAAFTIRLVGSTLRYEDIYDDAPGLRATGKDISHPIVIAFWHRTLLACAYRFRNRDIAILISRSFDGELIARVVERLGFRAIRGSSSRGGVSALRTLAEAYQQGHHCAITVDGPRGPSMVAQAGAAQLALLVQAPWICTFYALPARAWTLNTWDRFLIPKPFSKVLLAWSAHISVASDATTSELQAAVQAALDRSVTLAQSNDAATAPPP